MAWFRRRRAPAATAVAPIERRRSLFGRRYLADAPYMLPADDREINRLDFQHYMLRYALRGNYLAPVHDPRSILDVGCGTGRWALEMAHEFPQTNVVALDITPPPPEVAAEQGQDRRPENYAFVQANVLEGLPFADGSFDFVHQRLLFLAVPSARWPGLIDQLVRVTSPGGWVELVEGSAIPPGSGPSIVRWGAWLSAASARRGIDFALGGQIGASLRAAGLAHVRTRELRMQAGQRAGRLGSMLEANFYGLLAAVKPQIVGAGLAGPQEYDAVVQGVRADIAAGRCFWHAYVADGQRTR